jgi:hypothetical protein
MNNREVRKAAEAKVREGRSRQQVFDALKVEGTGLSDEALANIVRYTPSLALQRAYRTPHSVLLVLLWVTAVAKSLNGVVMALEQGWHRLPWVLILPSITILLGVAIARRRTRAYHTIAVLSAIGLLRLLLRKEWIADPFILIDIALAIAMAALAWYLFSKMASNYEVDDASDGTKRILFPAEPAMA